MAVRVALGADLIPWESAGAALGRSAGDTEVVSFIKGTTARSWPPLSGPRFCIAFVRSRFWKGASAGVLGRCQAR